MRSLLKAAHFVAMHQASPQLTPQSHQLRHHRPFSGEAEAALSSLYEHQNTDVGLRL